MKEEVKVETVFNCLGSCRRSNMSFSEINCVPGANKCPYCYGTLISIKLESTVNVILLNKNDTSSFLVVE